MSKIAGEINAEMMKKAIHDSRAKLFAEIVGKTGSQQSVIDCAMQEIESLRQQLAEREAQIVMLVHKQLDGHQRLDIMVRIQQRLNAIEGEKRITELKEGFAK